MKEEFLHYLWQYQLFNKAKLLTTDQYPVLIKKTGNLNLNSGPDFLEAQIHIGKQLWAGSVEIHLKSSDWYVHNHESDAAYDNVILHIVWEDDMPILRKNNTQISTLELKGLVPKSILNNYHNLFQKKKRWISCEHSINKTTDFILNNWLERLYIERLEKKSIEIDKLLKDSVNDWEAVLFNLLAKSFGLKVNGQSFMEIAKSIPFSIIRKEKMNAHNLEALLLGQGGLLNVPLDDLYYQDLQKIYNYQQKKYKLTSISQKIQFFRLRPPNFPTLRLSQLSNLLSINGNLFQILMKTKTNKGFYKVLSAQASQYWDTHYVFEKESRNISGKNIKKNTTKSFIDLLLINTILPLQFAYNRSIGKQDIESILQIIRGIKPENNSIIKKFSKLEIKTANALDSQALIMLKNEYCKPQRCLACAIGLDLLKQK